LLPDLQGAFRGGLDILTTRGPVNYAVPPWTHLSLNEEWRARCCATRERQLRRKPRKASVVLDSSANASLPFAQVVSKKRAHVSQSFQPHVVTQRENPQWTIGKIS
jgi:hypothetical protein